MTAFTKTARTRLRITLHSNPTPSSFFAGGTGPLCTPLPHQKRWSTSGGDLNKCVHTPPQAQAPAQRLEQVSATVQEETGGHNGVQIQALATLEPGPCSRVFSGTISISVPDALCVILDVLLSNVSHGQSADFALGDGFHK